MGETGEIRSMTLCLVPTHHLSIFGWDSGSTKKDEDIPNFCKQRYIHKRKYLFPLPLQIGSVVVSIVKCEQIAS